MNDGKALAIGGTVEIGPAEEECARGSQLEAVAGVHGKVVRPARNGRTLYRGVHGPKLRPALDTHH